MPFINLPTLPRRKRSGHRLRSPPWSPSSTPAGAAALPAPARSSKWPHDSGCGQGARTMPTYRRLAAVLAADVVGYSRLIGADEEGTIARLASIRKDVIDPTLAGSRGRIV